MKKKCCFFPQCVERLSDEDTLKSINQCFSSQQSKELLKMHGEKTSALRPKMTFVPTVTIDGSQGTQALILKNLYLEVCKVLSGGGPMPKECEDSMWWWIFRVNKKNIISFKDLYIILILNKLIFFSEFLMNLILMVFISFHKFYGCGKETLFVNNSI